MVTSRAETDSGAATPPSRRSEEEDDDDSEEKREVEEDEVEGAKPLKSALKRRRGERNFKCVSFNSTVTVYADDAPQGREEPVKGADTLYTFDPPPEYRDEEEDFDNGDWDCDWFPVVSVSRLTPEDDDDDDDDDDDEEEGSDEWDVLQARDEEDEDEGEDDDEESDDSQDTIVLTGTFEESNERGDDASLPAEGDDDSDVSTVADPEEAEEENQPQEDPSFLEYLEERELEEPRSRTSDIRRRMEESSCGRTSLEITEVKRRQPSGHPNRRASSTECLSEKLRWLVRPETLWDGDITVPGDVREWKIETSRSDELEQFVEQYLGRIERIRKRYSLTDPGLERNPSVRGIRPRFGSTVEILRRLQSQIGPPASVKCHPTWPPRGIGRHPEAEDQAGPEEERGVPEGASSSPPASSESYRDEGFIYYSLNV